AGRPEGWLGEPGHETINDAALPGAETPAALHSKAADVHASGTPGGGTAVGGLAGTNRGGGDPADADLEGAMGSSEFDVEAEEDEGDAEETQAFAGPAGGAVGGTPANKRTRGGKGTGAPQEGAKKPAGKTTRKNTKEAGKATDKKNTRGRRK